MNCVEREDYAFDAQDLAEIRQLLDRPGLTYEGLVEALRDYEPYDSFDRCVEQVERQTEQDICRLKPLITPYCPHPFAPPLPCRPDGELYGVGFIYDQDRDDRVLIAIESMLPRWPAVAVHERKGVLTVWAERYLPDLLELEVAADVWTVCQFVPTKTGWKPA